MDKKTVSSHSVLYILLAIILVTAAGFYVAEEFKSNNLSLNSALDSTPTPVAAPSIKDQGPAPEFTGISHWLNSQPLTLASLKGKVVLIDFWTYSCINCIRTLPTVTKWYDAYKDKGLVIIGVHTPEFAFEKETANVQMAIDNFHIKYPVAQDNSYATWNAYSNHYWPAEYLINQDGHLVYTHFGEGDPSETENAIRSLLKLSAINSQGMDADLLKIQSPEMYFGTSRLANLSPKQAPASTPNSYNLPANLGLNEFALGGSWQFSDSAAIMAGDAGQLRLKFHSGKLHLVASADQSATLEITIDGKAQPAVTVNKAMLYTLFDSTDYSDHLVDIKIKGRGFTAFTFTFG